MKVLRIIWIAHFAVVIALGISFYWNLKQASEASLRGQELYKIGLRDGEIFTRNQILRADLEREIIEDRQVELSREKL